MITSSREEDFRAKQEGSASDAGKNIISKASTTTTSSWSRLKDPRIVRVSRTFGGKDRHSKVCTVRGLRDRRVRLSVPTAIQLYDLQDRLGLNQPSKAVDWLLNVAKHEIDELPPLQMPPGNFIGQSLIHQPMLRSPHSEKLEGIKINNSSLDWEDRPLELQSRSNYWNISGKSKEDATSETSNGRERNGEGIKQSDDHEHGAFVSSGNFFSRITNHSSALPGNLLNNVMPSNSFLRWDPSNLSLSQFGSHGLVTPHQTEDVHNNFNVGSQLLVYPSAQTQSYFPSGEFDPKQINFHMLSSSGSSQNHLSSSSLTPPPFYMNQFAMRPNFHLSTNHKLFPSDQDNDINGNEPNKGN